ncbi:MAG: DNA replication and repair protein RecF [Candidatus Andersenbacteria bacterium]
MYIKSLALQNFRNFAEVEEIVFPPDALLVAAAPNATGKTNFLESIAMLLRGKSFRGSIEDCVRWQEQFFAIQGQAVTRQGDATIAVRYELPTRRLRIEENGVPASPVTFFSHYPFVMFLPEDTFLFSRGPALRRNFLNHILVSNASYLSALVQYHRALKQRNSALKTAQALTNVTAWTELLVEHSAPLWKARQGFVQFIDTHLNELYERISGETRPFTTRLLTTATPETYAAALAKSFSEEQRYRYTIHGPHRDDITITTDDRPIQSVLSRGQLRSVVIALKLAAHRYIKQTTNEEPLLLLDEVLSELDEQRQDILLKNLPVTQTVLTCTALPAILRERDNVHLLDLRSIIDTATPPPPALSESVVPVAEAAEDDDDEAVESEEKTPAQVDHAVV